MSYMYNITSIVAEEIEHKYVEWLKKSYIPVILSQNDFTTCNLFKIVDSPNEGVTYSMQLMTERLSKIRDFKNGLFEELTQKMQTEFNGKLYIFDSMMREIDLEEFR